jgi:hypothetical protein
MKTILFTILFSLVGSFAFAGGGPTSCFERTLSDIEGQAALAPQENVLLKNGYHEFYGTGLAYHCHNGFTAGFLGPQGDVVVLDVYNDINSELVLLHENFDSCSQLDFNHTNR